MPCKPLNLPPCPRAARGSRLSGLAVHFKPAKRDLQCIGGIYTHHAYDLRAIHILFTSLHPCCGLGAVNGCHLFVGAVPARVSAPLALQCTPASTIHNMPR